MCCVLLQPSWRYALASLQSDSRLWFEDQFEACPNTCCAAPVVYGNDAPPSTLRPSPMGGERHAHDDVKI